VGAHNGVGLMTMIGAACWSTVGLGRMTIGALRAGVGAVACLSKPDVFGDDGVSRGAFALDETVQSITRIYVHGRSLTHRLLSNKLSSIHLRTVRCCWRLL
jgi:hypothetical protein